MRSLRYYVTDPVAMLAEVTPASVKGQRRRDLPLRQGGIGMTFGKASLLTGGLVAMFALGVESGPAIRDSWSKTRVAESTVATPAANIDTAAPAEPVKAVRPAPRARTAARASDPLRANRDDGSIHAIAVSLWEPQLRNRVKTVLNPGTQLDLAATDFDSSEQFITVAHAARNTNVPFVVLKDRVLNQRKSLAEAIREFKPDLDARAEVARARSEARSDLDIAG